MDKDFELQWKDEQIAELRSALSGTITETENYNESVLDELETQGYEEYNLDGSDLGTKYDFNARHDFVITI